MGPALPGPLHRQSSPRPPRGRLPAPLEPPPRSLPPWLFMAVSKLQPPLEQLRPFDGDKAVKAAWEAPARPGPGPGGPCPPPGSLGPRRPAQRAPRGHASLATANFPDRAPRARYLCSSILPRTCPGPRQPCQPRRKTTPGRRGGGERENPRRKREGGSFSSASASYSSSCPSRQVKSQGRGGDIS